MNHEPISIRIIPARVIVGPRRWFIVNTKLETDSNEYISGPVLTQEMAAYCADECDAAFRASIRRMMSEMRASFARHANTRGWET